MTLGDGKRAVLMLIDEYSSGGVLTPDEDIDAKMNCFFDLAQQNIARFKKIVRSFTPVSTEPGETVFCPVPEDFLSPFRVWRDGALTRRYRWTQKGIYLSRSDVDKGKVEVEYFACPAKIPDNAPESYRFEVSEDAAACMPYFVAAQQLVADILVDYSSLLNLYDRMLAALDLSLPEHGGGGVRQGFYR